MKEENNIAKWYFEEKKKAPHEYVQRQFLFQA